MLRWSRIWRELAIYGSSWECTEANQNLVNLLAPLASFSTLPANVSIGLSNNNGLQSNQTATRFPKILTAKPTTPNETIDHPVEMSDDPVPSICWGSVLA